MIHGEPARAEPFDSAQDMLVEAVRLSSRRSPDSAPFDRPALCDVAPFDGLRVNGIGKEFGSHHTRMEEAHLHAWEPRD